MRRRALGWWDGAVWRYLPLTSPLAGRTGAGAAYDISRSELVIFSGSTGFTNQETYGLRYGNALPEENCRTGIDGDNDTLVGCNDPDCYGFCSPTCNPTVSTPAPCTTLGPRCGDGTCQPAESKRLCPQDCGGLPPAVCGDYICDASEMNATCPSDCP